MSDERVVGIGAVARVLGCSKPTVRRLLRRPVDPLRLWRAEYEKPPWAPRRRLELFRRRWQTPKDPELLASVLRGWSAIARVVRVSVRLARTLARRKVDPLPVWFTEKGLARALPCALRDWYDAHVRQHVPLVFEGGPTTREDVCPPRTSSERRMRETATEDRARSATRNETVSEVEKCCPPKKKPLAA